MSLTTRLMGLNSDGSTPASNPDRPKIPIRGFWASCVELIRNQLGSGGLTVSQVETMWDMNAVEIAGFTDLRNRAPAGTSATALANKALFLDAVIAIYQLGELRAPGYATAAEVDAKIAEL